jgi:predicted Rossmann fold flavoprotein
VVGIESRRVPAGAGDRSPTAAPEAPWVVLLEGGERVPASAVILATGGLSVAATGSDGRGLRWARELGHATNPTYPALTPLLADPAVHASLAGISLECTVEAGEGKERREARGGFLFTHRGYSGPAVLNVSHVAVRSGMAGGPRAPVRVAWTGEGEAVWDRRLQGNGRAVSSLLGELLPKRLAEVLQAEAGVPPDRTLAQLRREERGALVERLCAFPLPWTGDEGYKKAEVTGGGVALDQVDPGTMESRHHPGLYLCGEMLDAFGPIGGHNFLWAWATGRAAGRAAARSRVS